MKNVIANMIATTLSNVILSLIALLPQSTSPSELERPGLNHEGDRADLFLCQMVRNAERLPVRSERAIVEPRSMLAMKLSSSFVKWSS